MKKQFYLACLLLALGSFAKAEIHFQHGPWQEILAEAGKQNKLIFMDAYTTWCGPCKWMAANTFTNEEVAAYFNEHFINAKIDMEHDEGPALASKYNVRAYPTLLFVNASGELVHAAIGAMDAAKFLELGKNVLDPNFGSLQRMKEKFNTGETDREFLADFILALDNAGEDISAALARFRPGMAGAALLEETNWNVFDAVFHRIDTEEAQYFLSHLKDFQDRYGEIYANEKAIEFYSGPMEKAIAAGNAKEYQAAKNAFLGSGIKGAADQAMMYDIDWYKAQGDWANFVSVADKYVKKNKEMGVTMMNNFAWYVYEGCDDPKILKTALKWATRSCAKYPEYPNLDTKAMVLKKLGRKEEAIATAKQAIEAAKVTGEDYSATQAALDEMMGK